MTNKTGAPLTPAVLHILLALSTEERHGYGIMKQVEGESRGKVKMGPGTLYGSLGRMMNAGLIRESDRKFDPSMNDERRIYYTLTGLGRKALDAELDRYRDVVTVATKKRLTPNAFADGIRSRNRPISPLVRPLAPPVSAPVPRTLRRTDGADLHRPGPRTE